MTIQILLFLLVVSACSPKTNQELYQTRVEVTQETNQPTVEATQEFNHPTVIHHKAPDSKVETDWIEKAGCPLNEYSSGLYSGTCSSDSPLLKMGCDSITVDDLLGGLPYPMVTCENSNLMPLGNDYSQIGCYLSQRTVSLLTFRDGTYQFIGAKDVKAMSVPIESQEEALSYVLSTTKYYARYDIEIESYYEYYVDKIEATFIEETPKGYHLHLFSEPDPCGCDNHYTDAVDIIVDRNGDITIADSQRIYGFYGCAD